MTTIARWRLAWRLLFLLAALWVAWSGLAPTEALPSLGLWDKLAHAIGYGLLTLLLVPALDPPRAWLAGAWVMLYGIGIELAQAWGGHRQGDWQDALANGVGVLLAIALWEAGRLLLRRR